MLQSLIATDDSFSPTIARLALGIMIFPHGMQKLFGWFGGPGFGGTMHFFTDVMHIPTLFAVLAILAEGLGSLGLLLGLFGRVAAFGVACNMIVAAYMLNFANGFFMNWAGNQKGEGFEFHLLALGLALIVMIYGGGAFSIDRVLTERMETGRAVA